MYVYMFYTNTETLIQNVIVIYYKTNKTMNFRRTTLSIFITVTSISKLSNKKNKL